MSGGWANDAQCNLTVVPSARLVLQDVIYVRNILEDETRHIEWRLHWILAVVLLRTVGHVLHNVDGQTSPRVKTLAQAMHARWKGEDPADAIFRDFIERERNSILKEYASNMSEGPVPIVAHLQAQDGFDSIRHFLIEENIYRPIEDGPYAGEDGRTVLDDAIEWWHRQLDEIDQSFASTT